MNNDLISREALQKEIDFEYICNCCHNVNGNICDICHVAEIEKKIDNAPTVKAFTKEDMAGAYNEGYACGSRENTRPQGEWIPVSERLPKEDNDYLITYEYRGEKLVAKSWFNPRYGFAYGNVIAWQPLPEPYEKGGEEE